jgi:phosphatidate cytidylyltransferase
MDDLWFPYLIILAHFLSGAIWIIVINRKGNHDSAKQQWVKYLAYFILFNMIWFPIQIFNTGSLWIGFLILSGAVFEWWKAMRGQRLLWVLTLLFVLILAGFWKFLHFEKPVILYTYFVVVLFDGASQISGQLVGKRLLFPKISPRKTVEGLVGGVLITLASGLLVSHSFPISFTRSIWLILLVMASSFTGDLLASALKRKVEIEDFSHLLPGHGGILDRFDSFIAAGSLMFLLNFLSL